MEIPEIYLPMALEALNRDSQKGTLLEQAVVRENPTWTRDKLTVRECESLLRKFNLPSFDQKFRFCPKKGIVLC